MKFLILLSFFLPFICGAEGSKPPVTRYYHYDGKPIYLRKDSFRRYVIPQLKSMLKDYERLLQKINPLHEQLIVIRKKGDELSRFWNKTHFVCRNQFLQECEQGYRRIYALGRKMDLLGLDFLAKQTHFHSSGKSIEPDQMMALFVNLGKILQANYWILHYLEEGMVFGNIHQNAHVKLAKRMKPLTKNLKFYSDTVMTAFLSKQERKMFDFAWDNFYSLLDTYVVRGKDKEYLLRHLEDLNIAWHTFHMKMTKGFRKYPSRIEIFFTIMSKRWNSILKIILHTKKPAGS